MFVLGFVLALAGCASVAAEPVGSGGTGGAGGDAGPGDGATCSATEKRCGASCVAIDDPAWGCGSSTCEPCAIPNASASCVSLACELSACSAGFADCDGQSDNGCETSVASDPENCGACQTTCPSAGGTPSCASGSCGIACDADRGDCDGDATNGCETDVRSDGAHCGNCARDCHGTACTLGSCEGMWLTNEPAGSEGSGPIAVDGGQVYFVTGSGALARVAAAGGSPPSVLLPGGTRTLFDITVDATHVYAIDTLNRHVLRIPKTGGSAEQIGSITDYLIKTTDVFVVADDEAVYWTDFVQGLASNIRRWPKSGGSESIWYGGAAQEGMHGITIRDGYVYWTNSSAVLRAPVGPGPAAPEVVVSDEPAPTVMASDDDGVYWIARAEPDAFGGVAMWDPVTGSRQLLAKTAAVVALAPGASRLFFRNGSYLSGETRVLGVDKSGQSDPLPVLTQKSMLAESAYARSIAVDDTFVYINVPSKKGIVKVAQ
jgi:hypothetical protein